MPRKLRRRGREPSRGTYFYRDGQRLPLVKATERFALRLKDGRLPAHPATWAREPVPGLDNGYLCRVTAAAGENALKVANRLVEEGLALAAEPNFLRRMARRAGGPRSRAHHRAFIPNDPLFPRQWHLENRGRTGAKRGADVRALEAWAVTRGSRRITIAVIDDGFDLGHLDLSGRGKIVAPYDFGEDDPDPSSSRRRLIGQWRRAGRGGAPYTGPSRRSPPTTKADRLVDAVLEVFDPGVSGEKSRFAEARRRGAARG